jgi:predicted negative regulator of RcsB-dependent stress response
MRTAARRITRKDIRRPDRFVTMVRRFLSLSAAHRAALIAGIAASLAVLALLVGWDFYRSRQNRIASEEYARAVDLYHTGRYREALEALNRLEIYRSSFYSRLGMLYSANAQASLQDTNRAIETLQRLLSKESKEPVVRQGAYTSLGYLQEERGQFAEAAASFGEAEKIVGPLTADATLGRARSNRLAGNLKEAAASYRKFLTENPDSERASEIAFRIQELEAKAGAAAK